MSIPRVSMELLVKSRSPVCLGRYEISVREACRGFGIESALRKSELECMAGWERRRSVAWVREEKSKDDDEKEGMKVPAEVVGEGAVDPAMLMANSALVKAGSPTLVTPGINPDGFG